MLGIATLLLCIPLLHTKEKSATTPDSLQTYREKRDFEISPEPASGRGLIKGEKTIFMIHKHDSRRLHFDLRLQVGSVLASWAVPKGPSLNPQDKRLAVHVEDHPLAYAEFEGTIPAGSYGAGTVMIWDKGIYSNTTQSNGKPISLRKAIAQGHIEFFLEGQRLQGLFALVRMKGQSKQWLLIKMKDSYSSARKNPIQRYTTSVSTGRTMREIAKKQSKRDVEA